MKKKYPKEPGIILRRMRDNQGLTIKQASVEVGISAPYLYRIEGGSCRPPEQEILQKLLKIYGGVKTKSYFESIRRERQNNLIRIKNKIDSNLTKIRRQNRIQITPESQALRHLRKRAGLSIRDASLLLGLSSAGGYISQIENGRVNAPKGEKLEMFLKTFGSSKEEFSSLLMSSDIEEVSVKKGMILFKQLSEKNKCIVIQVMEAMASN